jgi:PadR family transcriptional regulator, regulatory protein PadR
MTDAFFDNWTTQLRKGVLELCILNAIRGGSRYGYDIVKRIRGIEGLVIGEGTVYPLLSRLKQEGLIASTIEESPEGPARKCYRLTARGREQLANMNLHWKSLGGGVQTLQEEKDHD